jgi:hypothetical protein
VGGPDSTNSDAGGVDAGGVDAGAIDAGGLDALSADAGGADVPGPPGCTAETPCTQTFEKCLVPGESIGCGMCNPTPVDCQSDADCTALPLGICIFKASDCTCDSVKLCHDGCAGDGDCAEGEVCAKDHHCTAKPCSKASDCPDLFACATASATCVRKNCDKSSDCGASGFCVNGTCHAKPGLCSPLPP